MNDTKYCYPESDILINKLNIHSAQELNKAETDCTTSRLYELQQNPIKGKFDFTHLKRIHEYIFQDLYGWAGKTRTVEIGKGNIFCLAQHIDSFAESVFKNFAKDCIAAKQNHEQFVHTFTEHYADMNALHPFREGNGRSQREFARELCLHCGYAFDLTKTCHEQMLEASIASFNGKNDKLETIFMQTITSVQDQKQQSCRTL